MFVIEHSNSLLEWPLEGMLIETIVIHLLLIILAYMLLRNIIPIVTLAIIIQIFLVGAIPVLRYHNELFMVSPWDSVAHYSLAKWIIEKGHVDASSTLYYIQTEQYKFHPGIEILPATLSILTALDLGISMNTIWFTSYISYTLALIATIKYLSHPTSERLRNVNIVIFMASVIMLLVRISPTYGGSEIGYAYLGPLLYLVINIIRDTSENKNLKRHYIFAMLMFLGVLVTHFASASIALLNLILYSIMTLMSSIINKNVIQRTIALLAILLLIIYTIYEVFIDIILFKAPLQIFIKTLQSLYVVEAPIIEARIRRGLTIEDLLLYIVSRETKTLILFGATVIYVALLLIKGANKLKHVEKLTVTFLFISYLLWIPVWMAGGTLMGGARILPILSFVLTLNIVVTFERSIITKEGIGILTIILYILMIVGFITNFGLPATPEIRLDNETYKPPTFIGFKNYALHPITFLSMYTSSSGPPFLCLHPYTAFGLCDLLWHTPKIPRVGFISPAVNTSDEVIRIIKAYLGKEVVIPLPTRDKVVPAPSDTLSFYMVPKYFMLNMCGGLIYSNSLYILFIC
jgi:hypothetical protein